MPPTWRVRADGLAEYTPTCKMVIGSCITELVSLSDRKTHWCIRKNNANLAKGNPPADSIGYKRVISGWRLGTMADLHPECRIFQGECSSGFSCSQLDRLFWQAAVVPAGHRRRHKSGSAPAREGQETGQENLPGQGPHDGHRAPGGWRPGGSRSSLC